MTAVTGALMLIRAGMLRSCVCLLASCLKHGSRLDSRAAVTLVEALARADELQMLMDVGRLNPSKESRKETQYSISGSDTTGRGLGVLMTPTCTSNSVGCQVKVTAGAHFPGTDKPGDDLRG